MAKKKIPRKKLLKEPDEFITVSARLLQWAALNRKRILWGAAAAACIALTVSGWMYYQRIREKKAVSAFGEIVAAYRTFEKDPKATESRNRTREALEAFVRKYPNTGSGKMGRVMYGNFCFQTGDLDGAEAAYRRALEDYRDQPQLKNVILSSIGHTLLKKQDPEGASSYFEQIASGESPLLKDEALFILAKIAEKKENTAGKFEKLNRILSDFSDSLYAAMAQEAVGPPAK